MTTSDQVLEVMLDASTYALNPNRDSVRGFECHHWDNADDVGDFIRVVRVGGTLFQRSGDRGTEGSTHVSNLGGDEAGRDAAAEIVHDYCRTRGYHVAFASPKSWTHPVHGPQSMDEHEAAFLAQWRYSAIGSSTGFRTDSHGPYWVYLTGLLAERPYHHGAASILDLVESRPHFIDHATDSVVAHLERVPYFDSSSVTSGSLDGFTTRMAIFCLAPSATPIAPIPDDPRLPELVHYQVRGVDLRNTGALHRARMVETAHRLARLDTTSHGKQL